MYRLSRQVDVVSILVEDPPGVFKDETVQDSRGRWRIK
jgi:hypothetical protein